MESPIEVLQLKAEEIEKAISYWNEVLKKSEKYERLMQDDDFKEVLKDMQETVRAHESEIQTCLDGMSEYTPKLLADAFHTIQVHQILKEQAKKAIDRPGEIINLAKKARVEIPELQEQLKKAKEVLANA